jgi:hypothetical protein
MHKCLIAAAAALAIGGAASVARAQDSAPSAVHGFVDLSLKNAYITPRGLLVVNKGLTTQLLTGLVLDLYQDASGPINDISVTGGFWNDFATAQNAAKVGSWNEFDYFFGPSVTFLNDWKAGISYLDFLSPPGNFKQEKNLETSLGFNDSPYLKPISFHPYAKLFYSVTGGSTVVVGKKGGTYDVEIGAVPTLATSLGIPVTFTMPTWFTVGPASYWGGTSNFGVFSTGLNAKTPLSFIPARFGNWYADTGIQYNNLINGSLIDAQIADGVASPKTAGNNNVWVGMIGIGFGF